MQKNQFLLLSSILAISILFFGASALAASPGLVINDGDRATRVREVTLDIRPTIGAREMRMSNTNEIKDGTWQPLRRTVKWDIAFGSGKREVRIQFRNAAKRHSDVFVDSIDLETPGRIRVETRLHDGEGETESRYVTIESEYSDGIESMAITNGDTFDDVRFIDVVEELNWVLSPGAGEKTVKIRFRDVKGNFHDFEKVITYDQPADHLEESIFLKGESDTVYYLGYGGRIHPFFHSVVFHSYQPDFSTIRHVSNSKLRQYFIGEPVCFRQGTWLVKFRSLPRVYAPEPGCDLRPIRSEAEAYILYGDRWAQRIVELDPVFSSYYTVREQSDERRVDDRDRDGVDRETERKYGTSDSTDDTDKDALSDYEEIFYWFTDPTRPDTDGDGIADGREITQGRSATGAGTLGELPKGAYTYPYGSIVHRWWDDKQYYYYHQDGHVYFIANRLSDEGFTSNDFQPRFVVSPPVEHEFTPRAGWRILPDHIYIKDPLTRVHGTITPL